MQEKTLISNYQAILLIIFTHIPTAVLFLPGLTLSYVAQDSWITIIIATFFIATLVIYPLADLGTHYPGKTIIQYSEDIMGKFLGKLLGLILVYWFFQIHCWSLRLFAEVSIIFLSKTPMIFIMIMLSLVIAYATYYGIEVIGRCTEFVFPLGLLALAIVVLASIENMEFSNILPIMESNILLHLRAVFYPLDWMSISFLFGVITAFINNKSDLKKIGFTGIGLAGIILTFFSIIVILVLGISILDISSFPLLTLTRYVEIPAIERIEILIFVLWITWLFIRGALACFCTVLGLSQLFNLKDYRFLIIPETILALAYSIYQYESSVELSYLFSIASIYYESIQIGIPFTLWLIFLARKGKSSNVCKQG